MKRIILLLLVLCFFLLSASQAIADSSITVSVVDGHGPVGGVAVAVLLGGTSVTSTTGPDGLANFSLPEGTYYFTALKEGYLKKSVEGRVGVDGTVSITIDRLYGVSGTIVDASTGLPVKDASVTITDKVSQQYYTGSTDSNGVFTILVPNGYYGILVRAADYRPTPRDNNGAGYQVLDNSLYVGYIPIPALSADTGNLEGVSLSCDFPGKTVKTNETVAFDVKISNNGVVDKTYSLVVKEAPEDWNIKFYSGNDVVSKVFVESKGSKAFQVKTTPLGSGGSVITIMAANGADNSSLQLFVDTSKDQDYKLEFTCPDNKTLDAGTSVNVEVLVKNNGSSKLTNVGLDIGAGDIPQSLTVDAPNRIDELGPGETHRFIVKIYAKADASQETDKLYLRAVSSEVKTDQKYIDVSVTKSNTWIEVGIAIALLAILAFGFIVWKYGRR
jgi:Fe-S cluster assembly iron-binding protein IscA